MLAVVTLALMATMALAVVAVAVLAVLAVVVVVAVAVAVAVVVRRCEALACSSRLASCVCAAYLRSLAFTSAALWE